MTTPILPSYVKILLEGYGHERESGLMRSDMESGPAKQVKFKHKVMITRTCNLYIESYELFEQFQDWFANDLKEGALWFTYQDPISQNNTLARFVGGGLKASPRSNAQRSWVVTTKIESWGA